MKKPPFERRLLAPRYWPAWLGIFFIFCLAWLPWPVQKLLGCFIGWVAWQVVGQRRNDTLVNLRLCFPELDASTHERMARDVFRQTGIGLLETANALFRKAQHYAPRLTVTGLEHLDRAHAEGRGVLLLGMHFVSMDLAGALASLHFKLDTVYRPQNNPVFEYMVTQNRGSTYQWQIDHDNMRGLLRAFKENHIVWYTPDQDFGLRQGVMAPFFGVPAATIIAPARLARSNHSPVVMVHFCRHDDDRYEIFFRPLADYPTGDDVADATRINRELELMIRRAPTQYMWYHRRFKTRPAGEPQLYQKKRRQVREERLEAEKKAREQQS